MSVCIKKGTLPANTWTSHSGDREW
jgi:hypothetical protein